MAISQIQPLPLLLASLFFLPALRAIALDFEYCNQSGYNFGNITSVEFTPNPDSPEYRPTVSVHGSASRSEGGLYNGKAKLALIVRDFYVTRKVYDLCSLDLCHIAPGRNFVFTISDYPLNPSKGLVDYKNAITLADPYVDGRDRLCVMFVLPRPAPKLVSALSS